MRCPTEKSAADVKAELQGALASELAARKFSYTRSDGSPGRSRSRTSSTATADLEMAYNPNDCVELRWARARQAATRPRPASGTRRQAQRAKMTKYRTWFRERHWPSHA